MNEWISVKDRLPKNGQLCLVIDVHSPGKHNERIFLGFYETREREFYNHSGDCIGSPDRHITHWMPLPQPPREGEE